MSHRDQHTLYICGLDSDVTEDRLDKFLHDLEGYIEVRLRKDKMGRYSFLLHNYSNIAFADFKTEDLVLKAQDEVSGKKLDPDSSTIMSASLHQQKKRSASAAGLSQPVNQRPPQPYPNYDMNGYGYIPPQPSYMLPPNARKTLYVENIPSDANEREVSHIFRPYPGFIRVRLIPKESNDKKFFLCFVDFDNEYNSTKALNGLNGYIFDVKTSHSISIQYARGTNK